MWRTVQGQGQPPAIQLRMQRCSCLRSLLCLPLGAAPGLVCARRKPRSYPCHEHCFDFFLEGPGRFAAEESTSKRGWLQGSWLGAQEGHRERVTLTVQTQCSHAFNEQERRGKDPKLSTSLVFIIYGCFKYFFVVCSVNTYVINNCSIILSLVTLSLRLWNKLKKKVYIPELGIYQ